MHLNPYGEYAVLLAASLANDWPEDRAGIVDRAESYGMQTPFANPQADDYTGVRRVIDDYPVAHLLRGSAYIRLFL